MFSKDFIIEYEHFDAQDLNLKHQIKINASCLDIGVNFIQKFLCQV